MSRLQYEKRLVVQQIVDTMSQSSSFFVAGFSRLNVAKLEELRKTLREDGIVIRVYKNRLLKIAANKLGYESLSDYLTGPNIYLFDTDESNRLAKAIHQFAKQNPDFVIKAGIWESDVIDANGVLQVAMLPTYEEALAKLSSSMIAPLQQLSMSLKLLCDKEMLQG